MALVIQGVSKRFGKVQALKDVSVTLSGRVVALMGPNSVGKTTLLRIMATVLQPDAGRLCFNGLEYAQNLQKLRAQIGYLPQHLDFPAGMRVEQLLTYFARLRAMPDVPLDLLNTMEITSLLRARVETLSDGELRRVGIVQALLGHPRLLLLDELTRGLDTLQRNRVFRVLHASGAQVIFSTHILEEAHAHANQSLHL